MKTRRSLLLLCLLALAVSSARAEDAEPGTDEDDLDLRVGEALAALEVEHADEAPEAKPRVIVYPHFNNGPRAVPRARGASLARAQALGLGGHETTRQMLWTRPSPELLAAVPGKAPKTLLWPVVDGKFGRGFGFTRKLRPELRHNGVDVAAPEGATVRAVADGLVVYSDNTLRGLGNAVMLLHAGGFTTLYAHTQRTTVQPGYFVKRGERIAIVGHTGMAWGPHLHFELRDNGRWRDPEPLFTGQRDVKLEGPLVDLTRVAPAKDPEPPKTKRAGTTRAGATQPDAHAQLASKQKKALD
jgi:murein DD-endopeptidase MepM/ murein hydrolase activator NlpD